MKPDKKTLEKILPKKTLDIPQIQLSARTLISLLEIDLVNKKNKTLHQMAENEYNKSMERIGNLVSKGFAARILARPDHLKMVRDAVLQAVQMMEMGGVAYVLADPQFNSLTRNDVNLVLALWLMKGSWRPVTIQPQEGEETDERKKPKPKPKIRPFTKRELNAYHRFEERALDNKNSFTASVQDRAGEVVGAACCAYFPKSEVLFLSDIKVQEGRFRTGVCSMLVKKAVETAKELAKQKQRSVKAIISEAKMPSAELTPEINKTRMEQLTILTEHGVYPASNLNYARAQESQRDKSPSPILLCIKTLPKQKQLSPQELKGVVKDVHQYYGSKAELAEIFKSAKESTVVKLMVLDTGKLLRLGKMMGLELH